MSVAVDEIRGGLRVCRGCGRVLDEDLSADHRVQYHPQCRTQARQQDQARYRNRRSRLDAITGLMGCTGVAITRRCLRAVCRKVFIARHKAAQYCGLECYAKDRCGRKSTK